MTALVIAEHDNASVKPAPPSTPSPRPSPARRRRPRAGRRPQRRRSRQGRRPDRRRGQGDPRRRRALRRTAWPRTSPPRCWPSPANYSHILFPATASGKNIAPRVAAKLDVGADLRHHQGRQPRHLRASDLRGQRDRHRAEPGREEGHHRAHHRLRSGGGHRRQRRGRDRRRPWPTAARASSWATRSPRATVPNSPPPRSSSRAAARWARPRSSTK